MRRPAILLVPLLIIALISLVLWAIFGGGEGEPAPSPTPTPTATPTPVPTAPLAPDSLEAFAVASSRVDLSWSDNSDNELGFRIERKAEGETRFWQIGAVGADKTDYVDITGLSEESTYSYRLRAFNKVGVSGYSNVANATTLGPEYNMLGSSAVGSKLSVSVVAAMKTDRYCEYNMWSPSTRKCQAPAGSAYVAVFASVTNRSGSPITVNRTEFRLRSSSSGASYGWYPYVGTYLGEPFPNNTELEKSRTVAGVILFLIPEATVLSGMEVVYVVDGEVNIWRL